MTRHRRLLAVLSLALVCTACDDDNRKTPGEEALAKRLHASNGIVVGEPKVYDDSVLQQMLNSAEAQLSSLQLLSQSGIAANFGAITGANQQISSFALSAQAGPPLAQTAITDNGATTQVAGTVAATPANSSVVTTTTAPVQNTTTTLSPPAAVTATPPAASTSMPSTFGVSASDILNEQMQVTYEVANLRLLMEGPLSDRILKGKGDRTFVKSRTTVGFPITINPDKRFKDAVAVVEVEVEADPNQNLSNDGQPPSITALLPREKTYNVAAITDHNTSIGGGVATQLAGVSASFLYGRKTYYIVKDQDTVALTFQPQVSAGSPARIGFLWEFRPVLGGEYVQSGLKQTFVQLSFPSPASAPSFGRIHVRTYWRKYDRNTGLLKGIVAGSLVEDAAHSEIPSFDMAPRFAALGPTDVEDLGNGQMLVNLPQDFLGGTYIRVGSTILQAGSPGFTSEYRRIRFIAPIADLATKDTVIVARDGTELHLRIDGPYDIKSNPIDIKEINLTALDESNTLLEIELKPFKEELHVPLSLIIGGKVFGYTDAPLRREGNKLSVVLPTGFLIANPEVTVKPLLVDDRYFRTVTLFSEGTEIERIVLLGQATKSATFLLFGRNLDAVKAVAPKIDLTPVGTGEANDKLRQFELPLDTAKTLKQMIFQRTGDRPFLVAMPSLATADQPKSPLKFQERVTVGADEALVIGDDIKTITKAQFQKKDLTVAKSGDGKSITLKGLAAAGATKTARTVDIDLFSATGKAGTIQLDVVTAKTETVPK